MKSDIGNKEWLNELGPLKQVNPNNPFTVPPGYFDELSERVVSAIHLNELTSAVPAAGFTVPENYFDELQSNIQGRINLEQVLGNDKGFIIPDNYFDQLTAQVQSRVFVEAALAETTESFTVPTGYFEKLNKNILNKTVNRDIVKRKSGLIRTMYNSPVFKYATAACFIAIIGAGVFFRPTTDPAKKHRTSYLHQELSGVSDQDLQNYLKLYADGNEALHIIKANGLSVNDAQIQSDLNTYIDTE